MTRWLRAAAVTGCTAVLCATAGITASSAVADDAPPAASSFTLAPTFAQIGQTLTLTAQGATAFPTDGSAAVTFNGDATPAPTQSVSSTVLDVVVPIDATSGPIAVVAGATTFAGPTFTLQQPTAWSAGLSPSLFTVGHAARVGATLTTTSGALPAPVTGVSASLQHRVSDSGAWHTAAGTSSKSTDENGHVGWKVRPSSDGEYRVKFAETPNFAASVSDPMHVKVRPKLSVASITTAPAGTISKITGTIHPHLAGQVLLEQKRGGSWHRVAATRASAGRFTFSIDPSGYSLLHYRVVRHADATHQSATSRTLDIQVVHGQLSLGSTGVDVLALQKRLRALHYDVGTTSSYYGWDLEHAVTAFQKVQGFYRNGVAGPSVWAKLAHPKVPHLLHKSVRGTSVEVNLKSQILMIAKNGRIWRILDTSTAGGYTYTDSAGEQATAVTPTGHFTIQYKINHLVKDKLGTLFRPSYFDTSGDAIHGEGDSNAGGDVPAYPASHGCVRITDLAVNRYYNTFAIGVQVWIYH